MTENRSQEPPGTIAVLIPALNEEDALPLVLNRVPRRVGRIVVVTMAPRTAQRRSLWPTGSKW